MLDLKIYRAIGKAPLNVEWMDKEHQDVLDYTDHTKIVVDTEHKTITDHYNRYGGFIARIEETLEED